jgi:Response regulator containing CheY-like receiver, AAA-type ATPase, and DNA-binding domains
MQALKTPEKPTALVIDDDPQTLLLCSRSLERCGFTVLTASGVASAKDAATQGKQVVLLIVDVLLRAPAFRLPGQEAEKAANGIEALPSLQQLYPRAVPLIISAYSKDELMALGHDPRDLAFLQKPFDPPTLRRTVEALLPGLASKESESTEVGEDAWFD